MNGHDPYPPGTAPLPEAPWNEVEWICEECGGNRSSKNHDHPQCAGDRCLDCPVTECPCCLSENLDQKNATCRDCGEEWER